MDGVAWWTVLRGGFFYENYIALMSSLKCADEVKFVGFCGPSSDPRDIGLVAAIASEKGGVVYEGSMLEIVGPERTWVREAVLAVGEVVAREVTFLLVGVSEFAGKLPHFLVQLFEYLLEVGEEAVPISTDVESVMGRKPVSFREWVAERKGLFKKAELVS